MKSKKGFTLLEVIVTITVIAIAASLFVTFLGSSFTRSGVPADLVNDQYTMIQQMELYNNQYRQQLNDALGQGTFPPLMTLNLFKTTYIDGKPFVDSTNTNIIIKPNLKSTDGAYTIQEDVLVVTLKNGDQSLATLFSK